MFHVHSPTRVCAAPWLSQLLGGRVPLEMFSTQLHNPPHSRGPGTAPDGTNQMGGLSSSSSLRASLKTKLQGSNKASEVSAAPRSNKVNLGTIGKRQQNTEAEPLWNWDSESHFWVTVRKSSAEGEPEQSPELRGGTR